MMSMQIARRINLCISPKAIVDWLSTIRPNYLSFTLTLATLAASAINGPAKAATAYFFSTPNTYTSFKRDIEGTWGTSSTSSAIWGTFDLGSGTSGSEVGSLATGTGAIKYYGNPYANNQNSGTATDGCSNSGNSSGCLYGSTSYTGTSNAGAYDSWIYDSTNNYLYFYKAIGGKDSIRLSLNTTGNLGLVFGDGWNRVSRIDWCSNDTQQTSPSCSNSKQWTLSSGTLAFIRVPSPGIIAGLIPFGAVLASRGRVGRRSRTIQS